MLLLLLITVKVKCENLGFGRMSTVSKSLRVENNDEEKQGRCWLRCSHAGPHPFSDTSAFLATITNHRRLELKEHFLFPNGSGGRLEVHD